MSDTEKNSSQDSSGGKNESSSVSLDVHQKETIRAALVESARHLLGIPYILGAEWNDYTLPPAALDCSEMVEGVYRMNGVRMPDGSQSQFEFTVSTGNPKPGDLVFFGKGAKPTEVYHVGLVFDGGNIIEARGYQPESSFETGKVILRPRASWESYKNWLGYRVHPKLV